MHSRFTEVHDVTTADVICTADLNSFTPSMTGKARRDMKIAHLAACLRGLRVVTPDYFASDGNKKDKSEAALVKFKPATTLPRRPVKLHLTPKFLSNHPATTAMVMESA